MNAETLELPQGPIHYRDRGAGEPILFVHGLLVDGRLWERTVESLSGSHRCIVPDWPMGSHRTAMDPDADLSPPGVASLIAAFLDELGLERATVVGNDTGGAISQILAADHPDRIERLVLTNCDTLEHFPPFPFNALPMIARVPAAWAVLTVPFRLGRVRRAAYAPLTKRPIDPALVDSWLAPLASDEGVRRDARKATAHLDKRHTIAAAERLRDRALPVRFAWASEDRLFKLDHAERLAAMLPDASIVEIEDAATFVSLDRPERLAEVIGGFVAEGSTKAEAA